MRLVHFWRSPCSFQNQQITVVILTVHAGFDTSKLNVTLPYEPLGSRPFIPLTNPFILPADAGTCNLGMPNGPRIFERFVWTIKFFTRNGFVVVADNHLVDDPTAVNDPAMWVSVSVSCLVTG